MVHICELSWRRMLVAFVLFALRKAGQAEALDAKYVHLKI